MLPPVQRALDRVGAVGATVDDLSTMTGLPAAVVRSALWIGTFQEKTVTCDRPKGVRAVDARYRLGDPTALLKVAVT